MSNYCFLCLWKLIVGKLHWQHLHVFVYFQCLNVEYKFLINLSISMARHWKPKITLFFLFSFFPLSLSLSLLAMETHKNQVLFENFICYIWLFGCNNNIFCNLKQHKKKEKEGRKEGRKEGMDSSSSSSLVGLTLPLIISLQCYRICVCCSCQACLTCILIAKS